MSDEVAKYDGIDILFGNIDVEAELAKLRPAPPIELPPVEPRPLRDLRPPRPVNDVLDEIRRERER